MSLTESCRVAKDFSPNRYFEGAPRHFVNQHIKTRLQGKFVIHDPTSRSSSASVCLPDAHVCFLVMPRHDSTTLVRVATDVGNVAFGDRTDRTINNGDTCTRYTYCADVLSVLGQAGLRGDSKSWSKTESQLIASLK